jgi:tape measure domain-containing protein
MAPSKQYEYIIYLNDKMSGTLKRVSALSVSQYQKIIDKQEQLNRSTDNYGNTLKRVLGGYLGAQGLSMLAKWGSELKQTQIQFQTLADTPVLGDKMYKEVVKYANITPYLTDQVSKAAVTMLSFGVIQKKIIPSIKMIGDIAGGNAERFEMLSLAFAQSQAAGKLMGQDLLQMVNAGFNPLQEISRKTGVSISVLRKQIEEGAISSKMVEDAFRSATSEGGRFNGMMNRMSQEAFAKWSNFIGNTKQGLAELSIKIQEGFKPMIDRMSSGAEAFLKWSENLNLNADRIARWVEIAYKAAKVLVIYKTATMGVVLVQKYLIPAYKAASFALYAMRFQMKFATAETFAFNNIVRVAKTTWMSFSTVMQSNAIGLAITGIALLVQKIMAARDRTMEAAQAQNLYNQELEKPAFIARQAAIDKFLTESGILSRQDGFSMLNNSQQAITAFSDFLQRSGIEELRTMQDMFQQEQAEIQRKIVNIQDAAKKNNTPASVIKTLLADETKYLNIYTGYLDRINQQISLSNKFSGKSDGLSFNNLTDASTNITSGGSRPTTINVNYGKLNEKIELHTTNLTEGIEEIEDRLSEMLLRVLNSSAKLANQ